MTYHKSVLVQEVVEYLVLKPNGIYIDATFGGGGHTKAVLQADPTVQVIALDWDTVALETNGVSVQEQFPARLHLIWGNFAHLDRIAKKEGIGPVDGILADFGTAQFQLAQKAGFSFYHDTPLDMRMSPAHYRVTAGEIINKASEQELYVIFKELGQEPRARFIARLIVAERTKKPFLTTRHLATCIERHIPKKGKLHPATLIFQALRIAVNHELENIRAFLASAARLLKPGGRLVCISFHSLEDVLVKQFFKEHTHQEPLLDTITRKVVVASLEEVQQNPSARSAKLRAAQKR